MKSKFLSLCTIVTVFVASTLQADERGKLIFSDNFDRNESQETKEELGHGWSTNSKARAGGHKQADLRDGTLHIYRHKTADHGVSIRHDAVFRNGRVELRFMLEHKKDTLGLNFADMKLKTVHAGHLFKVTVGLNKLEVTDLKTGTMDLKVRDARKANKVTPDIKKLLSTKKKVVPLKLKMGQWYALAVTISGDTISVAIDKKQTVKFTSTGFAHPTKRMLRLAVPREAVVDDLKIFSAISASSTEK